VPTLAQIVASPPLSTQLGWVVRPRVDRVVAGVALIEDLAALAGLAPGTVALLTVTATAMTATYRLDMALRAGRSRELAALVVPARAATRITPTAAAIADRSGTAILASDDAVDLAVLSAALSREIAGESDVALMRAHAAMRAIDAHPVDGTRDALLRHVSAVLDVPISWSAERPDVRITVAIGVGGGRGWLSAVDREGDLALATEMVVRLTADRVRADSVRERSAESRPVATQIAFLTELIAEPPSRRDPLLERARALGVPIDDWHIAVRVDFQDLADADDERAAWEARQTYGIALLRAARDAGGTWHGARIGPAFALVRTFPEAPDAEAAAGVADAVDALLVDLRPQMPSTLVRCGVGGAHQGVAGLVTSLDEAKAVVATERAAGRVGTGAVTFDSTELRRALVEWYASDVARDAVATVLSPLTELGGARGERLLQTLHVYLDQQGSLTKTASRLNLHRNAVAYRIAQAFKLLDVDPDNPDDLLLLQLACRARELG
jgi:sugar diacid utilization regulator